jgi:hypothetical protein
LSDLKPISVGEILVMREEFDHTSRKPDMARGVVVRAEKLVRLLDEVLMWRESAGAETEDGNA